MAAAARLLDELAPGELTAVVGRPGSGVSTLLHGLTSREAMRGGHAVLASWECPPERLPGAVGAGVVVPEILGWGVDELVRSSAIAEAPPGALVGIDHLQLIGTDDGVALGVIREAARVARLRIAVGVMAPRSLEPLDQAITGALATDAVAAELGPMLASVDRMAIIIGAASDDRSLAVAAIDGGSRPALRWCERLGEAQG